MTTPFTMSRLLEANCSMFLRLCHLVMDEVDVLYARAPTEVTFHNATHTKLDELSPFLPV